MSRARSHRQKRSAKLGASSSTAAFSPTGTVRTDRIGAVPQLPGYDDGAWWVQDAAAALPARLLGDVRGKTVADLCAAPGGKTAQLAGRREGHRRRPLGAAPRAAAREFRAPALSAEVVAADAEAWQAGPFDAILLDAPCSSTGTIRRHPDIPWLKSETDLPSSRAADPPARSRRQSWSSRAARWSIAPARWKPRRARRRSRRCSAGIRACAATRSGPTSSLASPIAHTRRRSADPALPLALCQAPHGRARRLRWPPIRPRNEDNPRGGLGRCSRLRYMCMGLGRGAKGARSPQRGEHIHVRPVDWGAGQAISASGPADLRRSPVACAAIRFIRLRLHPPQGRPAVDRAAGSAHRRPHPRQRNYSGRFAFAGKVVISDGRSPFEIAPPSEEWEASLLGFGWLRHLRAAERLSRAPTPARWSTNGSSVQGACNFGRAGSRETTAARRVTLLAEPGAAHSA